MTLPDKNEGEDPKVEEKSNDEEVKDKVVFSKSVGNIGSMSDL